MSIGAYYVKYGRSLSNSKTDISYINSSAGLGLVYLSKFKHYMTIGRLQLMNKFRYCHCFTPCPFMAI